MLLDDRDDGLVVEGTASPGALATKGRRREGGVGVGEQRACALNLLFQLRTWSLVSFPHGKVYRVLSWKKKKGSKEQKKGKSNAAPSCFS